MIFQWTSESASAYLRKFMSDKTIGRVSRQIKNFSMLKWFSFGNGLLRPACASFRNEAAEGVFYDNGFRELNEFLAPELGHVCMQETIMQFLVKFCGYSQAESDTVRRAIAKKGGTGSLLPEIERRFIEYSPAHYDISEQKCAEVIKPFLQVILDASSYSFSWNHAQPYSAIGYICGYLRTYYPYEFVTASLNIFRDDANKTKSITEYANAQNIRIVSPVFGSSKADYFFDQNAMTISKGISSVKFLNADVADKLYDISQAHSFDSFVDVLDVIFTESSINTRQLEVLIRIDYFSTFGNTRELLSIADMYDRLKRGTAKELSKAKLTDTEARIVSMFATDIGVGGKVLKSYKITDMPGLLHALEAEILSRGYPDFDFRAKMQDQEELLGYIDLTTGKKEDRKKLLVTEFTALKAKENGLPWCYRISARSLGTGKTARLSIRPKLYDAQPFQKGDMILAHDVKKNPAGYWYITNYERVC